MTKLMLVLRFLIFLFLLFDTHTLQALFYLMQKKQQRRKTRFFLSLFPRNADSDLFSTLHAREDVGGKGWGGWGQDEKRAKKWSSPPSPRAASP